MSQDGSLEVEVKFLVADLASIRERLLALDAEQRKPRLFEHNVRYDDAQESLRYGEQLLRLRQDDRARLTFKGRPQDPASSQAKVREELEVLVGDFATTGAILERLGFAPRQVYEKYRETFVLEDVEVVLDEMPFGDFVELEGEEGAIRRVASRLNLLWEKRILDNYLHLMARLKDHHGLPFDDLTFENFEGLEISIADVLGEAEHNPGL